MRAPNIPITSLAPPEEVRKAGKTSLGLKQDVTGCTNSDAIPQPRARGEGAAACKRGVPKKSVSSAFWEEAGVITDFLISQEPSSPLFCVCVIRSGRQRRCVVSPRVSRRGARSFKGRNGAWGGGGMGRLQSPGTNTFLLLVPNFFWGSVEISSLFHWGCLNKTLQSLLVRPQIGFSF